MMERIDIDDGERIRKIIEELDMEGGDLEEDDNLEKLWDSDYSDQDRDYSPSDQEVQDEVEVIRDFEKEKQSKKDSKGNANKRRKVISDTSSSASSSVNEKQSSSETIYHLVPKKSDFMGKNGFHWKAQPNVQRGKIPNKNIIHIRPGPIKNLAPDPESCFNLFLTTDILDEIVLRTNEEMERQRKNYKTTNTTVRDTCIEEMKASIGILFLSAALKDNHLCTKLLFDSDFCGDRYRASMSRERFMFITYCIRFDDKETREERRAESKLAPIKDVWDSFVSNCIANYKPSSYCTIDEQLVGFRGRCPFRVYMCNKPNKYGLKIVMICDNATKYMIKAIPYLGKGTTPEGRAVADYFVEQLVGEMRGSHRNITMDNWFVSVPLVKKLYNDYGLTVVGTIKKNKQELPLEFVDLKYLQRDVNSSFFLFSENITAVSYKPRTNKLVTPVSSMHDDASIHRTSKKPEIVLTYNQTKGAVDTLDQMCQNMNCGRKTRRWPLCMFYNILNIAAINSYVIYVHQFFKYALGTTPSSRLNFMIDLQQQLTRPWQIQRAAIPSLNKELKTAIQKVLKRDNEPQQSPMQKGPRKYCSYCHYSKRRLTTVYCAACSKPICGEHQKKICLTCK